MAVLRWCAVLALVLAVPGALAAQEWGGRAVDELVRRAAARREAAEADPGLVRWEARGRGLVLFLSQLGDAGRSRLVKADELLVEVYWEAPGPGKQRIVAWRDRAWLPTDIQYHRDHLGIVTNDFGPVIRLGEGDEVRDVPHPLASGAAGQYEFALADSLTLQSADRVLTVYRILVRPRDLGRPGVIGTLFLDAASGALVRFRFSFTPVSYRDPAIEDISVVLENALHAGRHWLPWRQEIEIRRRAGIVDFPVRGVIRAEWQLEDHRVGPDLPAAVVAGPPLGGLLTPGGPSAAWEETLEARVARRAGVVEPLDRAQLIREVQDLAGARLPVSGPPARLAVGRVSDLVRVNRVEGLRLGSAVSLRPGGWPGLTIVPWVGYGTANRKVSARLEMAVPVGVAGELAIGAGRVVRDLSGDPPVSGPLNSILAQEAGIDRGDWVDHESAWLRIGWRLPGAAALTGRLAMEEWHTVATAATPANGAFRENPPLGAGRHGTVRLEFLGDGVPGARLRRAWRTAVEMGSGAGTFLRLDGALELAGPLGPGEAGLRGEGGWAAGELPPAREFAIGGWGSLPGEPYRAWGGRWSALARVEYLLAVPVPELQLGSFVGTGQQWQVGPFLAAGAAGGGAAGLPWGNSGGVRPVVGLAIEGFWRMLRAEVGVSLRGGGVGASVDIARSWWSVL